MSTIYQVSIGFIWCNLMLLNFVHCPRFQPVTPELSGKIYTTWPWRCPCYLEDFMRFYGDFMVYIYTNGDDRWKGYQIRAWSCYMLWSLICRRFVDHSFSFIFCIKDGNDLSQFSRTEVNNYSLSYSLRRRKSISTGTTIPLYVIICCQQIVHSHQYSTKCCGFKIIFQHLIHWTEMFV